MITVKEHNDQKIVQANVTEFTDAMGYCEHKIPFYLKGQKARPSQSTIQGSKTHKNLEIVEKRDVRLEAVTEEILADHEQDIEYYREDIFTRMLEPMIIDDQKVTLMLLGRADKVLRDSGTLIVEDEKTAYNPKSYDSLERPYKGQRLQVLAYLNSLFTTEGSMSEDDWFEIPHERKMWRLNIRTKNSTEPYRVFEGYQNDGDQEFLRENMRRFASLVVGAEERQHHNSPNKCRPCGYYADCAVRIES